MTQTRYYHIPRSGNMVSMATLDEALQVMKTEGFIWLEYCQPTKEELCKLMEPLGLHPLAIEDCTDDNQIPKIEDYPGHTFILFNGFDYSNQAVTIYELDMFIGDKYLVTISRCESESQPLLKSLEHFVEVDLESSRQGPAFLAHAILDHIVDQKFIAIEALEDQLNVIEDAILDDAANFEPGKLLDLRRELLALRKSLFHEREILVKICRNDCRFISEKAILLYRDIYDHLAKFFELTESYREIQTSLMEMYLSMINNRMAKAANDTNATVRRLTFITTIFMPLSLLAGIGGMSEWSMMTGPENWKVTYPLFLVLMAVVGVANYYLLKWVEKRHPPKD